MWLNHERIANLLSIPQLEKDGYKTECNTKHDWVVTTPQGKEIGFNRDTKFCNSMAYINIHKDKEGHLMLQTFKKNIKGFIKKQVKKATSDRNTQVMMAHSSDDQFDQVVSNKSLDNYDV